jgi:hypothetical protein
VLPDNYFYMKRLKKALRLTGLIIMIILACFGVGISGTPPVLPKLNNRAKIEYAEEKEDGENE